MRLVSYIAVGLASIVVVEAVVLDQAAGLPFRAGLPESADNLQRVDDACWWWGTRWQYGWRGYGWYPCWDWPKPAPTAIAPEAAPDPAAITESCERTWRDAGGQQHRRRVC
jgi:hypothetical protein